MQHGARVTAKAIAGIQEPHGKDVLGHLQAAVHCSHQKDRWQGKNCSFSWCTHPKGLRSSWGGDCQQPSTRASQGSQLLSLQLQLICFPPIKKAFTPLRENLSWEFWSPKGLTVLYISEKIFGKDAGTSCMCPKRTGAPFCRGELMI